MTPPSNNGRSDAAPTRSSSVYRTPDAGGVSTPGVKKKKKKGVFDASKHKASPGRTSYTMKRAPDPEAGQDQGSPNGGASNGWETSPQGGMDGQGGLMTPPDANPEAGQAEEAPDLNQGNQGGDPGGNGDPPPDDPPPDDPPQDPPDDDDDHYIIIYCPCCGHPWWDCIWCHHWTPYFWFYYGYNSYWWDHHWYAGKLGAVYHEYHNYYDFETTYPNIYSIPARVLDAEEQCIALLDEGADLFRQGLYLEALHKFRMAALTDLDFAVPKFAYAHALFALGMYDYAAYELRLGLELLPDWVEIGGDLKLMYGDEADFEEQIKALMAHVTQVPADEDALLVLGYVGYFSGDLYLAEKAFRALADIPTDTAEWASTLFLDAIEKIKALLREEDPDCDLLEEDGLTLFEVI